MKRKFLGYTILVSALLGSTMAFAGDAIRKIELLTRPQAQQPQEFQTSELVAQAWRKLGLDVEVRTLPYEQIVDYIYVQRKGWDITTWNMWARPERSDPDELMFSLLHSSTIPAGYNFVGYDNPEYDKLIEAARAETDPPKRQAIIFEAQKLLQSDMPLIPIVHKRLVYAFNSDVWDAATVVNQAGIGLRNFWTYNQITPREDRKDIILNTGDTVLAISPLWVSGQADSWVTELIYDRLMRIGPDGLPQPWAAESVEYVDGATIKVVLRQGMTWHDGKPVTVEDIKFSFDAAASDQAPAYKPFVSNVESVEIVDDTTLTIHLKEPSAPFLVTTLAKINMIPKHVWEPVLEDLKAKGETVESYKEPSPVGSGPFAFNRWLPSEEIVLDAYAKHFSPPKASRWIVRTVPNMESVLGMMRSGELNLLADFSGDPQVLVDIVNADDKLELVETIDMGVNYLQFNNRRPPFDDVKFRNALAEAVNKKLIINAAYKGYAVPAYSVVSPAIEFWLNPDLIAEGVGDMEAAAKTLKEAGYELVDGKLHYPGDTAETLNK